MTIDLLANHPGCVGTVAAWLVREWGDPQDPTAVETLTAALRSRMSHDALPMHLLAIEDGQAAGFIALKLWEMDHDPDREHWLGSLFVPAERRGRGIGSALIEELLQRCPRHRVTRLSLQTERLDGGLYLRHGWTPVGNILSHGDEVLIMERRLPPTTSLTPTV